MWHRASVWRALLSAVIVSGSCASAVLLAQGGTPPLTPSTPSTGQGQRGAWRPAKTAWGHPDLQGIWTSNEMAGVPFERPKEVAGRAFFTDEEIKKRKAEGEKLSQDDKQERTGQVGNEQGPTHWYEWFGRNSRRTSLIVDPPDGVLPALTPAGEKMRMVPGTFSPGPWNGPEDFNTWDRCITRGLPSAMVPTAYNNAFQIFQTPHEVVILHELIHIVRIIPIDSRPHVHSSIALWEGDARGRWEGNTLVVDVSNFTDNIKGSFPALGFGGPHTFTGTGATMHLVERWTRTAADTLKYEATITDPSIFTKPWTIALDLRLDNSYRIYEYACHEGNRAIENTLKGSRAEEKNAGRF
jgi:hypothetical protein